MKTTTALMTVALCLTLSTGLAAQSCLGTQSLLGDDIDMFVNINQSFVPGDTHTINPGESLRFVSGSGTLSSPEYYIVAELAGAPAMIPGVCVSGDPLSTIVLPAGGFSSGGNFYDLGMYPGGAGGISLTVQCFVPTSGGANGAYVTSDPLTITFN